jgi:hypothetical protein
MIAGYDTTISGVFLRRAFCFVLHIRILIVFFLHGIPLGCLDEVYLL